MQSFHVQTPRPEAPSQGKVLLTITGAVVATLCFGALYLSGDVGCALSPSLCRDVLPAPSQHLYAQRPTSTTTFVNTKTGAMFRVKRRSSAMKAAKGGDKAKDKAARATLAGLLTVASMVNPVEAGAQGSVVPQLIQAFNEDFGMEYGQWDMAVNQLPVHVAPALVAQTATIPMDDVVLPQKVVPAPDPVNQVIAEWNKEFGADYGAWQVTTPSAVKVQQPRLQPVVATVDRSIRSTLNTPELTVMDGSKVVSESIVQPSLVTEVAKALGVVAGAFSLLAGIAIAVSKSASGWQRVGELTPIVEDTLQVVSEPQAAPGLYSFSLATDGGMHLESAERLAWTPKVYPTDALSEEVPVSVERANSSPTVKRTPDTTPPPSPRSWPQPRTMRPAMGMTTAMAGTSGQRNVEIPQPPEEYMFTCDKNGRMKLQYARKLENQAKDAPYSGLPW